MWSTEFKPEVMHAHDHTHDHTRVYIKISKFFHH